MIVKEKLASHYNETYTHFIQLFHFLTTGIVNHVDDEYKWAGVEDPKIMITTSRDPSSKLKQFAKVIFNVFTYIFLKFGLGLDIKNMLWIIFWLNLFV